MLLLLRVLTPEAAVLRTHFHQHTDDTVTVRYAAQVGAKAVFSAKHQHCQTEHLFDAPFQPAAPLLMPAPLELRAYAVYRPQAPVCRASHLLDGASLRGPPTGRI
ncbi:hypothetical protein ACFPAF_05885 [Hymenobacter endophyticus]|uniref:Uncharacterized protein n=1 Tax=Hymenobacter endophyticus TaxID=3076335 RepID=A0ABU3TEW0_9BACT|nr:hypothetical protein [Hymenobacter endophyticus]MDU0369917.1 hypothetical protein [Hymenobacter endophyticus]